MLGNPTYWLAGIPEINTETKESFPGSISQIFSLHETRMAKNLAPDYDKAGDEGEIKVKIICLGDSAVGKSKWVSAANFSLNKIGHLREMPLLTPPTFLK